MTDYAREDLLTVDWYDFEQLTGQLFKALGYDVIVTPRTNDGGADLHLSKEGQRAVVQCKRYQLGRSIGFEHLRDLYGAMHADRADYAYFVTTSSFTKNARAFANQHPTLHLIDGDEFINRCQKLGLLSTSGGGMKKT